MASLVITNSFVSNTTALAAAVNTNFTDVSTYVNNRNAGTTAWDYLKATNTLTVTATTNQIVLGTTNTSTINSTAPSAARVYTIPDAGGDASFVMTLLTQTISGVKTFDGQLIGKGTATNDSAAAGYIGEPIRSSVTTGVSSPGSTQFFDVTSISLTAGDWDISGLVIFTLNASVQTVALMAITSTSGNSTTGQIDGDNRGAVTVPVAANDSSGSIPGYRVSLSGTVIYYLKARADFSAGTPKAYGRISARRVR